MRAPGAPYHWQYWPLSTTQPIVGSRTTCNETWAAPNVTPVASRAFDHVGVGFR
jgi:hypothetical protein